MARLSMRRCCKAGEVRFDEPMTKSASRNPKRIANKRSVGQRGPQAETQKTRPAWFPYLLGAIALTLITIAAFANTLGAGFVLDSKGLLLDPRIRDVTWENVALIFHRTYWWPIGEAGLYRPATTLSYLLNYAVLGGRDDAGGYHLLNLLLHLGNVWLVWALALRLTRKFWPSMTLAALWAVHPILTESVSNIVGRSDLLAGMAVLSGLLMYIKSTEANGGTRLLWLIGITAVTTVGVFSKESAVAIFPVLVLYHVAIRRQSVRDRTLWLASGATLLPILVMLSLRATVLASSPPAEFPFTDNPIVGASWLIARLTAVKVIAHYLWLSIWPAKLSCDYSYNQIRLATGAPADWLACVAVAALSAGAILLYRVNRVCFFLAGFAFLNFLPASNLLFPVGTIMAERLLYLPSVGVLGCLVIGMYALTPSQRASLVLTAVLLLIAAAFAVRTWSRNRDWQSDLAIASSDVRVSPRSFKLHRLLAASMFDSDPSHSNLDQVISEQEKSMAILDSVPVALSPPDVYRTAGYYYLLKAREGNSSFYAKAIQSLLRGISIDAAGRERYRARFNTGDATLSEGDAQAWFFLSAAYLESGAPDKALDPVLRARSLDPLNPQVFRQLSAVLLAQERRPEAQIAAMMEDAITSMQREDWRDAADLSARVFQFDPSGYPAALYLSALANFRLGNLQAAEQQAREAIRLDPTVKNPRILYVLGLILAQKGDLVASANLLRSYLEKLPNAPNSEIVRTQLHNIEASAASKGSQ